MGKLAAKLREKIPYDVFTEIELFNLIKNTPDSVHSQIKRAAANGDILRFKRGVYAFGGIYQREPLNSFEIANKMYAPSYVSLESALSFHGWIPEATYTVTSVSAKRSKEFKSEAGVFSFTRIAAFNFVGVERIEQNNSVFLIATPLKALFDYVCTHKIKAQNITDVLQSLRIEREYLEELQDPLFSEIASSYKSKKIRRFSERLKKELKI